MPWAKPEVRSRGWNLNAIFLLSISEISGLSVFLCEREQPAPPKAIMRVE